jgi:hypothetical protein
MSDSHKTVCARGSGIDGRFLISGIDVASEKMDWRAPPSEAIKVFGGFAPNGARMNELGFECWTALA